MRNSVKSKAVMRIPKPTPGGWVYHPFEVTIAGYSGSGKTTLIEKLCSQLGEEGVSTGYFKHDAHKFIMDKEGKDTERVKKAGAGGIAIQDPLHSAFILEHGNSGTDEAVLEQSFSPFDVLFIEGNKHSPMAKIVMLDPRNEIDAELAAGSFENVLAISGPAEAQTRAEKFIQSGGAYTRIPFINRDSTGEIIAFLRSYWQQRTPDIKGLVLIGGASSRMGTDKSALRYAGNISQALHMHRLLSQSCKEVFLSAAPDQIITADGDNIPVLRDRFKGFGPLSGILTALEHDPMSAWMVASCDLPLLSHDDLETLITERNPKKAATCFGSPPLEKDQVTDGSLMPEPLCAIYEPKARPRLLSLLGRGIFCPRRALRTSPVKIIYPENPDSLFNANNPEERKLASELLKERTKKSQQKAGIHHENKI
ncbi:MAG: molybdopterin-guanine dinucleotide biosynthesis protein B [Spirochaetales bacterium]|nr:molybdopterin-guanine dinucleotide biosynthesis protein B [Spirochaetales bacterium]